MIKKKKANRNKEVNMFMPWMSFNLVCCMPQSGWSGWETFIPTCLFDCQRMGARDRGRKLFDKEPASWKVPQVFIYILCFSLGWISCLFWLLSGA